jgi:hypothetical protein
MAAAEREAALSRLRAVCNTPEVYGHAGALAERLYRTGVHPTLNAAIDHVTAVLAAGEEPR